jgi:radical SAM protein with 4Fe4S-binding SPASM domain
VPTGRAVPDLLLTAAEHERTYRDLAVLANDPATPFAVKTTAGQPFYRVLAQLRGAAPTPQLTRKDLVQTGALRSPSAINDGVGFVFVGRRGDICPSGFLPLVCGNIRKQSLAEVYSTHPTFVRLRRPETYNGKCGVCEYNRICGGSRSRTYGLTGDPFGSDPTCVYQPKGSVQVAPAGAV